MWLFCVAIQGQLLWRKQAIWARERSRGNLFITGVCESGLGWNEMLMGVPWKPFNWGQILKRLGGREEESRGWGWCWGWGFRQSWTGQPEPRVYLPEEKQPWGDQRRRHCTAVTLPPWQRLLSPGSVCEAQAEQDERALLDSIKLHN